jgi:hypothetical protein
MHYYVFENNLNQFLIKGAKIFSFSALAWLITRFDFLFKNFANKAAFSIET